jgi:hypothetical protein
MKQLLAFASSILAEVVCVQGDDKRATMLLEESMVLFQEIGDKWGIAFGLSLLGTVVYAQGDHRRATALYEESLVLRRELGDKYGIAECLEGLAGVAVAQRQLERAARLFGAAEALREAIGAPLSPRERARYDHNLSATRVELGEAGFAAAWTAGKTTMLEQASASNG